MGSNFGREHIVTFDITSDGKGWEIPIGVRESLKLSLSAGEPVSVNLIDFDSTKRESWLPGFQRVVLYKMARREDNRQLQIDEAVNCLDKALRDVKREHGGSDVLGALQEVGRKSRHAPDSTRVDFVSNGLANTERLNLGPFRKNREPFAEIMKREKFALPDLRGSSVTFYYLGQKSDTGRKLQSEELRWLKRFWRTMCEEAQAQQCVISEETPVYRNGRG